MNTLAEFSGRPLTSAQDIRGTSLQVAVARVNSTRALLGNNPARPETEALRFYYGNHLMALVLKEVGPHGDLGQFKPLVERYYEAQTAAATRLLYYLIYITTREARHLPEHITLTNIDPQVAKFLKTTKGDEVSFFKQLLAKPPVTNLGAYVQGLSAAFFAQGWSSAYGGPKWGGISDCLLRYVQGECSAEATLDTAFTLAHNGGPIFNKGDVYASYGGTFIRILDYQAAGLIPSFLNAKVGAAWKDLDAGLKADFMIGHALFPDDHNPKLVDVAPPKAQDHGHTKKKPHASGAVISDGTSFQIDAFKTVKQISEEVHAELQAEAKMEAAAHTPKNAMATLAAAKLKKAMMALDFETMDAMPDPQMKATTTKKGNPISFKKGKIS
jgi:hypothetical protein